MIDPLLLQIISFGFALLFITAALHKFNNKLEFLGILQAYQILPDKSAGLVVNFLPALEAVLGITWLLSGLLSFQLEFVSLLSAMLLTAYTMAIGINLLRGRRHIDCGCGFSSLAKSGSTALSSGGIQQLSGGLVIRNGLLILAAMIAAIPPTQRALGFMDNLNLVAALIALILLYGAFNQLLANNNAIGAWRNSAPADKTMGDAHD
jgi:hypothetical protein